MMLLALIFTQGHSSSECPEERSDKEAADHVHREPEESSRDVTATLDQGTVAVAL